MFFILILKFVIYIYTYLKNINEYSYELMNKPSNQIRKKQ